MGIRQNGSRNNNPFSFSPSLPRTTLPSRFTLPGSLGNQELLDASKRARHACSRGHSRVNGVAGTWSTRVNAINDPYDLFLNKKRNRLELKIIQDLRPIFKRLGVDLRDVVVVVGTKHGNPSAMGMKISLPTLFPGLSNNADVAKEIFHELGHVVQYVAALGIDPMNGAKRFMNRYNYEKYLVLQSGHLLAEQVFDDENIHIMYEQPVELKAMDLKLLGKFKLLNPRYTLDAQCNRLRDILWDRWKLHKPW